MFRTLEVPVLCRHEWVTGDHMQTALFDHPGLSSQVSGVGLYCLVDRLITGGLQAYSIVLSQVGRHKELSALESFNCNSFFCINLFFTHKV